MAAVTVIRLLGYIWMPSCSALTCRRRNMGGEYANQLLLNLSTQNRFNLVLSGPMPTLMSSCNSYTNMLMNQRTLSASLLVHHNNQGVKTAQKLHLSQLIQNEKEIRNMHLTPAQTAAVTVIHAYLPTRKPCQSFSWYTVITRV